MERRPPLTYLPTTYTHTRTHRHRPPTLIPKRRKDALKRNCKKKIWKEKENLEKKSQFLPSSLTTLPVCFVYAHMHTHIENKGGHLNEKRGKRERRLCKEKDDTKITLQRERGRVVGACFVARKCWALPLSTTFTGSS